LTRKNGFNTLNGRIEERVSENSYFLEDLWEQADDIPEDKRKGIRALLLPAAFQGLQSRDDRLLFLRCHWFKFPYEVIATMFKPSASSVYRAIKKREEANNDLQSAEPISLDETAFSMTLTPTEEHRLMA
jgi:hypothetical protein